MDEIKDKLRIAGFKVTSDAYGHTTGRHNYWTIKPDGSLSRGGFEIVSPILSGQAGLEAVGKMAWLLEETAKVDTTCGVHVHHGANGITSGLQRLDRYHVVNFRAVSQYGTIEFRQLQSTVSARKAQAWVVFTQALIEYAVSVKKATTITAKKFKDVVENRLYIAGQERDLVMELVSQFKGKGEGCGFPPKEPISSAVMALAPRTYMDFYEAKVIMGHARYATHGTWLNPINNHPHQAGKYTLIHNGVIHTKPAGIHLDSECDSEILVKVIERAGGIGKAFDELCNLIGSFALLCWDGKTLWFTRNPGSPGVYAEADMNTTTTNTIRAAEAIAVKNTLRRVDRCKSCCYVWQWSMDGTYRCYLDSAFISPNNVCECFEEKHEYEY